MPPGTQPPLIIQYSASTVPILQYAFSSPKLSEQEMFDVVANQVRVGMATTRGALIPWPYGGKTPVISVDLDLTALKAKNLAPTDVVNAINAQNIILPGGTAKVGPTEYDISVNGTINGTVNDLNHIPVKFVNGATIELHEVAQVHDGYNPQQNAVRQDGERGALLTIMKSGTASTLDVVKNAKDAMPGIMGSVTSDLKVKEFADQSLFVRAAVNGVLREGIVAAALTALMILLFLGSWRSTLIIALSIPLSVLCSIAVLSVLGETINLMTLGGLALAVGILVDDATVAIENIHRHMVTGKNLEEAILDGAQEIALPAFVSTLCICIVFVPMFFLTGVAHYLFVPLAEAVVFAMLASYVISRTLVPTLVMWFYRNVHSHGEQEDYTNSPAWIRPFVHIQRVFERGFERFREGYRALLSACLARRGVFGLTFLGFCVASAVLVLPLGQDFFPSVDAGQFLLHVRARTGTRIEETIQLCASIDAAIRKEIPAKEIHGIMDNIGIPNSSVNLSYNTSGVVGPADADILVSLNAGHRPTEEYIRRLRKTLGRAISRQPLLFSAGGHCEPNVEFRFARALRYSNCRPRSGEQSKSCSGPCGANSSCARRRGCAFASAGGFAALECGREPHEGGGTGFDRAKRGQLGPAEPQRQQPGVALLLARYKIWRSISDQHARAGVYDEFRGNIRIDAH